VTLACRCPTPEHHAAVIITARGLRQQPGDPWGVAADVAEALGLKPGPRPAETPLQARQRRQSEARRARREQAREADE